MSLHSSLPHNIRQSLTNFSGSLFISNKTRDCGDGHHNIRADEMVSSLPLQMALYFNVVFFPFWWASEVAVIQLKYSMLPGYYQWLLLAAVIILTLIECVRLFLGYMGNLQEKLPELAGFWLLSFTIQLPIILFLLTDESIIILPLEQAVHILYFTFLVFELVAAFLALREMTNHLATCFYLQQFQKTECPQLHSRCPETGIPRGRDTISNV
ncbi:transmembrane protein 17-like [Carcharodon carcharias]|uniref:transmembrane protein 17-like n=1 Tax=Carcharodon carcharias TaxID=13397 RepID=UPI001B7EEA39|nr:transmembrane protein 17-like [Carcharodon carcharias]